MTCIKMGSDESHFNVSLIVRDKVTRPCPQTTTFEEKGEPKRYRTEVLPLYQPTALPLGQTGSQPELWNYYLLYSARSRKTADQLPFNVLLNTYQGVCVEVSFAVVNKSNVNVGMCWWFLFQLDCFLLLIVLCISGQKQVNEPRV